LVRWLVDGSIGPDKLQVPARLTELRLQLQLRREAGSTKELCAPLFNCSLPLQLTCLMAQLGVDLTTQLVSRLDVRHGHRDADGECDRHGRDYGKPTAQW
jgi:hypothetical protein